MADGTGGDVKDLTNEEVDKLNQQRTSAQTMEWSDLLYINKVKSMKIIKAGTEDQQYVDRITFLLKLPLFQQINKNHLQPLISNIVVRKYHKGEYIQRAGEEPEGLIIIREGYAVCVADKISCRAVSKRA